MKITIFITGFLCLALASCREGGTERAELPPGFQGDLVINYEQDLDKIVKKADVADLVDIPADRIKVYNENFGDSASVHMLLFSWKDGHSLPIETTGGSRTIDSYASIGVGRIERISEADFEKKYRQKTSETVKAEIEAITKDESVDPDIAIWEAKERVKTAKNQSFEKLEKVGKAAYWESPVNVLHIFVGNAAFSISANLDEDSDVNKEKAIALAGLIFQKLTP